ncbi:cysteine desulfurase family protein [Tautonia rosea]|uniref:cysteine desulfurase family protein n=1 Tax=Tautonia rosea TaxID=2728037 RepID=UPI001474B733|nr:cysteine desulfurase family protein [Tautonia rosea]
MGPIYLDHNASAPLAPEVLEAMRPFWLAPGNPESRHSFGRHPRRAYEHARETIASILNADTSEVIFTSGGTESNNLAIFGIAGDDRPAEVRHLVTSPIEHPAVSEAVDHLETQGVVVDRAEVGQDGRVDPEAMANRLRPGSTLATLILAQNETGVLQNVQGLAERARELGVPVHTDAVQAVGRVPVDFRQLGVATLATSAHKFHGPAGVGVLLVRSDVSLTPRLFGGGQQSGKRAGTPAVALAVGMAEALRLWHRDAEQRIDRWIRLRDRLESFLVAGLGRASVIRTGPEDAQDRLPQTLHLAFPNLDGDALLMQLDLVGVAASLGSACASGSTQPSATLMAMKVPEDRIRSSVRFSLGATTTEEEIDEAALRIIEVVRRIRSGDGELTQGPT